MTIVAVNPAAGEDLARFAEQSPAAVEQALTLAAAAFRAWRMVRLEERCPAVAGVGERLRTHREELARLATADMGELLRESLAEVDKAAGFWEHYVEHAAGYLSPRRLDGGRVENWLHYEPLGPVLAVMPWNFPYAQVFRLAPAMRVAGTVGLLKHAFVVPRCALRIADLFAEARPNAVEAIVADHRVQVVPLTDSERAGSAVAAVAGRELKTSPLEQGVSEPLVVLDDADVAVASAACRSRFSNKRRACVNAMLLIVLEVVADAFVAEVRRLRVGDPLDERSMLGPLARHAFLDACPSRSRRRCARGARLETGGFDDARPGAFVDPIVLTGVTPDMQIFREERAGRSRPSRACTTRRRRSWPMTPTTGRARQCGQQTSRVDAGGALELEAGMGVRQRRRRVHRLSAVRRAIAQWLRSRTRQLAAARVHRVKSVALALPPTDGQNNEEMLRNESTACSRAGQ